jgi:hypothetical protein
MRRTPYRLVSYYWVILIQNSSKKYLNIQFVPRRKHTDRLMLFRKVIAFYCENRMNEISTLYGRNAKFFNLKADDIYSKQYALKGWEGMKVSIIKHFV